MRVLRLAMTAVLGAASVLAVSAAPAQAATVPSGFNHVVVTSALVKPVAMAVATDGRVFVTEKGGYTTSGSQLLSRIRVIKAGKLLATPFATLPNVFGGGERGLLGITLDPKFTTNHYLYVFETVRAGDGYENRVSRLTASGDVAVTSGGVPVEKVLYSTDPASNDEHQSGALHFGTDGKIYFTTGDNKQTDQSPLLTSTYGKLMRINPDGTIPSDNPFVGRGATGKYQAIWARGLRNPFTFAVQPKTGRLLVNDVGENAYEEIDDGIAGSNYGWPSSEGPTGLPGFRGPLYYYGHTASAADPVSGCAITGGDFYNPTTVKFPSSYVGSYLFADFCSSWIKRFDPVSGSVTDFVSTDESPIDVRTGPDGSLYYLTNNGELVHISYTGSAVPSISQAPAGYTASVGETAPFTVSATGPGTLTYQWQRNGSTIAGATSATYTTPATKTTDNGALYRVVVKNSKGSVTSATATLTVTTDKRPTVSFTAPATGSTYAGGDPISYAATGNDAEDGVLPGSAFSYRIDFHHHTHLHPFLDGISGSSFGTFVVPKVGEVSSDVYYRINVTVTDKDGLTQTAYRDVLPRKATISLATSPAGLALELDGQPHVTPYAEQGVSGITRELSAPTEQTDSSGVVYDFISWSDGGDATHDLDTPDASTTYTALYARAGTSGNLTHKPDLVVTGISASPASPQVGDLVRFSATITNQGDAATPAGTKHGVLFKVNGANISYSDTSTASLAPGASRTVSANGNASGYTTASGGLWQATAGMATVLAMVDDVNRIAESHEDNNTLSTTLSVSSGQPDLVVSSVSPVTPAAGDAVAFTAVITNTGTASTLAGTIIGVSFRVDGKPTTFSDTSTASLAPGESRTLTANGGGTSGQWIATAGAHTLLVWVDDINRIPESDETDNTLTVDLPVT